MGTIKRGIKMKPCDCTQLKTGRNFSDGAEVEDLEETLRSRAFKEVPVRKKLVPAHHERWFKCPACGRIWRFIDPDPPFEGIWEEIGTAK
jgi:hypothetical protein